MAKKAATPVVSTYSHLTEKYGVLSSSEIAGLDTLPDPGMLHAQIMADDDWLKKALISLWNASDTPDNSVSEFDFVSCGCNEEENKFLSMCAEWTSHGQDLVDTHKTEARKILSEHMDYARKLEILSQYKFVETSRGKTYTGTPFITDPQPAIP